MGKKKKKRKRKKKEYRSSKRNKGRKISETHTQRSRLLIEENVNNRVANENVDRILTANDDLSEFILFNERIQRLYRKDPGALPLNSPYLQSVTACTTNH